MYYSGEKFTRYTKKKVIKGQKNNYKKAIVTLKKGDIITALDGKPVVDFEALTKLIKKVKIGQGITVGIERGGKHLDLKAKMGSRG